MTTIEGLAPRGQLHPVQQAFWEEYGAPVRLLHARYDPLDRRLLARIARSQRGGDSARAEGNICRCTGYHNIVRAVRSAADKLAAGAEPGSRS